MFHLTTLVMHLLIIVNTTSSPVIFFFADQLDMCKMTLQNYQVINMRLLTVVSLQLCFDC